MKITGDFIVLVLLLVSSCSPMVHYLFGVGTLRAEAKISGQLPVASGQKLI
jgi:hypothetical protein